MPPGVGPSGPPSHQAPKGVKAGPSLADLYCCRASVEETQMSELKMLPMGSLGKDFIDPEYLPEGPVNTLLARTRASFMAESPRA